MQRTNGVMKQRNNQPKHSTRRRGLLIYHTTLQYTICTTPCRILLLVISKLIDRLYVLQNIDIIVCTCIGCEPYKLNVFTTNFSSIQEAFCYTVETTTTAAAVAAATLGQIKYPKTYQMYTFSINLIRSIVPIKLQNYIKMPFSVTWYMNVESCCVVDDDNSNNESALCPLFNMYNSMCWCVGGRWTFGVSASKGHVHPEQNFSISIQQIST